MNSEAKNYKIHIFDEEYNLVTDETEERILESALYVDSLMKEIAEKSLLKDVKKIAVLASLRIANKILQLEKDIDQRKHEEADLINRIEQDFSLITPYCKEK